MERLGTGIGWRPEIADAVENMPGIDWVEAVAENVCPGHLPESLRRLRERGVTVVPHGVSLGLGGADRPDAGRLLALAERAEALGSPLVTEHIAFVRAGGPLTASARLEAGHLLPVPRTRDALDVLCENIRIAQDALPVPLAVENIAALIAWPGEEMTEGQFLYELADRTGVRLLIDVANLHTNHVNRGEDPAEALAELPWRPSRTSMSRAASSGTGCGTTATPTRCRGRSSTSSPSSRPGSHRPGCCWSGTRTSPNRPSWKGSWRRSGKRWRRGRCAGHRCVARCRGAVERLDRARPAAGRARPDRAAVRARGRDTGARGVRPGAAGGAGAGARGEAGGRGGEGGARAAGDPRGGLPAGVPGVRAGGADDGRVPAGRAGLRRTPPAGRGAGGRAGAAGTAGVVAGAFRPGTEVPEAGSPAGPGHAEGAAAAVRVRVRGRAAVSGRTRRKWILTRQ